jgi:hypothetical protein
MRLKVVTSPKLVLITRWITSSKLNTTRLKVSTIYTMTKGTETTSITISETELPRYLGRAGLTA